MKKYVKLFILPIILLSVGSCKDNDGIIACPEIYVPLIANIKYLDNDGKDLIFADTPVYPPESIKIYKTGPDDQPVPLMLTINKNAKFLAVNLEKVENGTFYIELKTGIKDKITYSAKIDGSIPCSDFKLIDIHQNDVPAQYDDKNQVWILQK